MNKLINFLKAYGPDRVVINSYGEGVPAERAVKEYNIKSEVVYIRKDGWTLGAPKCLSDVANRLWTDEWIGIINLK